MRWPLRSVWTHSLFVSTRLLLNAMPRCYSLQPGSGLGAANGSAPNAQQKRKFNWFGIAYVQRGGSVNAIVAEIEVNPSTGPEPWYGECGLTPIMA